MIIVKSQNEGLSLEIFELLREYFPSREHGDDIEVEIFPDFSIKISLNEETFILKDNFSLNDKAKIKRNILLSLFSYIELNPKYGILTGVRPTKLLRKLMHKNGAEKAKEILKEKYLVEKKKIDELYQIVIREENLISKKRSNISLYFHIPFCPSICSYCSFKTYIGTDDAKKTYLKNLIYEFKSVDKNLVPSSIYIGGGTPTSLSHQMLEELLYEIREKFDTNCEFTVECGRPKTIDYKMLSILKNYGVNRISINPQTMNDKTLNIIGRTHCTSDIIEAYNLSKSFGFIINMDLILGLPDEDRDDFLYSLKKIMELNPENITIHSLAIKNGSKIFSKYNFRNMGDIMDNTKKNLYDRGYNPYYLYRQKRMVETSENIGFSKENFECLYNVLIMEESESILGFGVSSSTKILNNSNKFKQHLNFRDLKQYNERIDEIIKKKRLLMEEL